MSEDKKKSRFLDKWILVRAAARDGARLSMGDVSVLIALCDRYGSEYDIDAPALAGHALLAKMTGLSRRATIDSTRRLIDAGYITVIEPGSGSRGTKYGLNFASGEPQTTTSGHMPSGEPEFTSVVNQRSPLDGLSGEPQTTTLPPTLSRLQASLHVVDSSPPATPAAPPAGGLGATAAAAAGFDDFWKVWPKKVARKKAQAEWVKVTGRNADIIAAASTWANHYKAHGTDRKWIPDPANWLRDERWEEDLPAARADTKSGRATAKPKTDDVVRRDVTVTSVAKSGTAWRVDVLFNDIDAGDAPTAALTYSDDELSELMRCAGLTPEMDEVEATEGFRFILAIDEDDNHHFEQCQAAA